MPWITSNGKFVVFFALLFFCFLLLISCRSTEHDHVKDNLSTKLLRIRIFGEMKLEEFKKLIFIANYKMCDTKMDKHPTWYNPTCRNPR